MAEPTRDADRIDELQAYVGGLVVAVGKLSEAVAVLAAGSPDAEHRALVSLALAQDAMVRAEAAAGAGAAVGSPRSPDHVPGGVWRRPPPGP